MIGAGPVWRTRATQARTALLAEAQVPIGASRPRRKRHEEPAVWRTLVGAARPWVEATRCRGPPDEAGIPGKIMSALLWSGAPIPRRIAPDQT